MIAKWAISLDGLIATRTGESRWISGELSRGVVHLIRGRVDGIVVGRRTLQADDPLLTARPAGPRVATRIVYAGSGSVPLTCQLVQTASRIPTLLVVDQSCLRPAHAELEQHGCEVLSIESLRSREGLLHSLRVLGARGMTNLLLEGGSGLLGAFFDAGAVNEVHVFVAPKVIGGAGGTSAVGGLGISHLAESWGLGSCAWEPLGEDIYIHGTVAKSGSNPG